MGTAFRPLSSHEEPGTTTASIGMFIRQCAFECREGRFTPSDTPRARALVVTISVGPPYWLGGFRSSPAPSVP